MMNSAARIMMLGKSSLPRASTTIAAVSFHPPATIHTIQYRHFSRRKSSKKKPDPFKVLGITRDDTYAKAKQTFIDIAMSHHPDTSEAASEEEKAHYREIFMKSRRAFEQLSEGEDGEILLKREKEEMEGMHDFSVWLCVSSKGGHHQTPKPSMHYRLLKRDSHILRASIVSPLS